MADETAGLKPRPEFGEGIFEGPPPAEPEPGTPEFGERAKRRALNQSPDALTARSGLTPTPEELAAATPPGPPQTSPASMMQPGAQPPEFGADLLKLFDVPAPALDTLLHDPTPPDPSDPEGDIIKRLTDSILGDQTQIPQPRGFTPGEHLALGIMGALDGEVFQSVVLPMLMAEREAPRQAALDMEAQKARRINALQSLATLMSSRREHEATLEMQERGQDIDIARMRQQAAEANANRRLQLLLAQQRERSRQSARVKVGDRVMGTYTLAAIAVQNAMKMKRILDNNVGVMGNLPGGTFAGHLPRWKVIPGTEARAELAALGGTVSEAILMINQRRGTSKETMKKIGDALPDITMGAEQYRRAVENAIREYGLYMTGQEALFPQLVGVKGNMAELLKKAGETGDVEADTDAISAIVHDPESWLGVNFGMSDISQPGYANGDTDLRLFRDDSEVP